MRIKAIPDALLRSFHHPRMDLIESAGFYLPFATVFIRSIDDYPRAMHRPEVES